MLSKRDMETYLIWSGGGSKVEELRPEFGRAARWFTEMGVKRSPLSPEVHWYSVEATQGHGLFNLWLMDHNPVAEQENVHEHRDLLAQIGVPVRPYKGTRRLKK